MKHRAWWRRIGHAAVTALVLVSVGAWLLGPAAAAGVSGRQVYVPNEYIVHALKGSSLAAVEASVSRMGATIVKQLPLDDTYLVRMGRSGGVSYGHGAVRRACSWAIQGIQPNYCYYPSSVPNDEYWAKQWDMRLIDMPAAWDLAKGSSAVTVAVIDTGVANHPDLTNRLIAGYDYVDNDSDPSNDLDGHGTHVAGTIAAQGNNSIGIAGVCWNGVKIMPLRILGPAGGTTAAAIQAGDFAMQNGADVVNMSYGGYGEDPAERAKLAEMANAGMILVAAAGNDATDTPSYPAGFEEVISVSSVGPYDAPAPYTNYGKVEIAAPGGDSTLGADAEIWSTTVRFDTGGKATFGYGGMEGTSMACPHVAGAAALLLSHGVPAEEVRSRLLSSARPPKSGGMDPLYYGAGILDVQAALANASLKITQPAKGGTVGANPEFRISIQGISTNSIRVYLDYADLNDDGIPDSADESVVIDGTNVNYYLNSTNSAISFKWSDFSQGQMYTGRHNIYASASAAAGGTQVTDWATFTVARRLIPKGIHLFAFPHVLTDRVANGPSLALPDAGFRPTEVPRSRLIRWIATPRSLTDSTPVGYETYSQGNLADRVWVNPVYTLGGVGLPTGGGYGTYRDLLDPLGSAQRSFSFPAGAGFWLILPSDAYVDESWFTTSQGPLDGLAGFDGSKGFDIRLYKGWNMIGNPYMHSVSWRAALLTYRGVTKCLADAEAAGWVSAAVYGYGGATTGYQRISDRDMLEPYRGYWVRALVGGASDSDSLILNVLP